ncbi:HD domain-containing protein [bacterium]|nr:HD domain-containing protein [bacterium]
MPSEDFQSRLLKLFEEIHPLDAVPRAGFVLRGVVGPESVAAHSHFVSLLTLLVVDTFPDDFDRHKALTMALIHDLPEALLMDIPMPVSDAHLRVAKAHAEQAIFEGLFEGWPAEYAALHREIQEAQSPEARLVRGLDKAQMMMKVLMYELEGRGRLEEFWHNPANFRDYGIEAVSSLFDRICEKAGRERPGEGQARSK